MAFCPNCGNKLPDNAKFCASCGAKIAMPAAPAAEQSAPEAPMQQENHQPPAQNTQPVQSYQQPVHNTPPVQNYQQPMQQAPVQSAPNAAPTKPANKKLIAIIGCCVLAAILITVLICTLGSSKSSGAATDPNAGVYTAVTETPTPAPIVANLPDSLTSSYTALQKQWNGAWYGVMHVIESSGSFSSIPQGDYDAFLTVDIDENGEGTFEVYLDGYDTPLAAAECYAAEDGLYARKGSFAGSEMNIYNWMFLPIPAYANQYAMGDTVNENGSVFDFTMFVKPWGADWDAEMADDALFPPSVELYYDSIESGGLPPYGGAPYYYNFN